MTIFSVLRADGNSHRMPTFLQSAVYEKFLKFSFLPPLAFLFPKTLFSDVCLKL